MRFGTNNKTNERNQYQYKHKKSIAISRGGWRLKLDTIYYDKSTKTNIYIMFGIWRMCQCHNVILLKYLNIFHGFYLLFPLIPPFNFSFFSKFLRFAIQRWAFRTIQVHSILHLWSVEYIFVVFAIKNWKQWRSLVLKGKLPIWKCVSIVISHMVHDKVNMCIVCTPHCLVTFLGLNIWLWFRFLQSSYACNILYHKNEPSNREMKWERVEVEVE